tara:strand:+ start:832 stop:1206 length:375 start_codon:yes stop_codon:yes gene_type:complete
MKTITASDRSTLIRLASSLPKGDETRKAILHSLSSFTPVERTAARNYDKAVGGATCYDPGNGTPGEPGCYHRLYDYGKADSGTPKSDKRKDYNRRWREKTDSGDNMLKRKICPDGKGGEADCTS